MTYSEFFSRAFGGSATPFAYQRALADQDWPDALIAPTGLGKTAAVVLAWLWKRTAATAPRRLVYCLPMRTLAEQTASNISAWLGRLSSIHAEWQQRLPDAARDVHLLMGGANERRWFEHPERPAILVGTQDLLISRALMRGYAMSRFRWPVDFALLHNDSQWVFDEVQLMNSGLATSTQLEGFRRSLGTEVAAASLWVSATLHPQWLRTVDAPSDLRVWRVPCDFPEDRRSPLVRTLLDAPKPIAPATLRPASAKKVDVGAYVRHMAEHIREHHRPNRMTLAILNTVTRAQQVYAALIKQGVPQQQVALIHSRFRFPDRQAQMHRLPSPRAASDLIVVTTQAIEAGVDLSAATLITELAPASSMVQRFGRVNRYGELNNTGGATIRWIDLACGDDALAAPYEPQQLADARTRIAALHDASPSNLPPPEAGDYHHRWVIRRKDLFDLYDSDPDLTGFDVDVSPYVRDAEDTDVHLFWREFDRSDGPVDQPPPRREELCPAPIGQVRNWLKQLRSKRQLRAYLADPQTRSRGGRDHASAWTPLDAAPWPGLVLMLHVSAGGYSTATGFDPAVTAAAVVPTHQESDSREVEALDADPESERHTAVPLSDHLRHVETEAERLVDALGAVGNRREVIQAARWHDVGKAHAAFQERLGTSPAGPLLAKAHHYDRTKGRSYFRHELASALAWLTHAGWARSADLVAYLIAAHHGKVRMNLRALPGEQPPNDADGRRDARRFARGVWEGDDLPTIGVRPGDRWPGGALSLSIMDLGEDPVSGASWTERSRSLLDSFGPFRLAWLEALVRIADWRASADETVTAHRG
ncbi:MAG: CRISPR-associated helicase Cas3' [Spirochaetaceae bacterium]|nr:CRISPR-associated helicase Cas3' [Spirochaetaceae bacterium]